MPGAFDSTTQLTAQSDPDLNLKPNNLNEAVDPNDATAQENVVLDDQVKLRMLGYKPVLGRPFGFWSSAGMNICYLSWIYESIICSIVFGYPAPLVFLIGYPILCGLHLILLGPFAELASAFPVAGAMATWTWRIAREPGIRREREWGWLASGLVLAAHLGKIIGNLYTTTISFEQLYIVMTHIPYNPFTLEATHPKAWWRPVFNTVLVSFIALMVFTRLARNSIFWIGAGFWALYFCLFTMVLYIMCMLKTHHLKVDFGFPTRKEWTHSLSYMIFTSIPFKVLSVDGPAHMAEETENPEITVPRVMYASTILHFVLTYIVTALFIFGVAPYAIGRGAISPVTPTQMILHMSDRNLFAFNICGLLCAVTQLISSTVVTSRFIFSLARDHGLPFSKLLSKTNKYKQPWAAELAVILSLYAAIAAWWVNQTRYYNVVQAFQFWFMPMSYVIPLGLYLFSDLDLQHVGRTQFTLRRWSKPCAAIALAWLIVVLVQGSFPLSFWYKPMNKKDVDDIASLPFICLGLMVVSAISWFLYGRHHYVGPLVALVKGDFSTSAKREKAIKEYMRNNGNLPLSNDMRSSSDETSSGLSLKKRLVKMVTPATSGTRSGGSGPRSGTGDLPPKTAALPESAMLPITTVPITTGYGSAAASVLGESQLLPTDTRWRTQQPIIEEPEDLYISEGGSDIPMDHLDRLDHASPSASQLDQHTYISSVLPESQLDPLATNNNIYRSRW